MIEGPQGIHIKYGDKLIVDPLRGSYCVNSVRFVLIYPRHLTCTFIFSRPSQKPRCGIFTALVNTIALF